MAEQVSSLLRRSVEHLADEVPDSYRLVLDELGPMVVELDVDGELLLVCAAAADSRSQSVKRIRRARIATSRAAILDVLDAKVGLGEAVEAGTVACAARSTTSSVRTTPARLRPRRCPGTVSPGLLAALRTGPS